MAKAIQSEGQTPGSKRRAHALARSMSAHLTRLRKQPTAYGRLGMSELLELQMHTLREFGFFDIYR